MDEGVTGVGLDQVDAALEEGAGLGGVCDLPDREGAAIDGEGTCGWKEVHIAEDVDRVDGVDGGSAEVGVVFGGDAAGEGAAVAGREKDLLGEGEEDGAICEGFAVGEDGV